MAKVTLDMGTFKALASETRLDILRALDGKKMSLKDISAVTNLNKATLHEHLAKLNEAGLIKRKEREGHKWVYYKLSWKGECLLHPENTRVVVMFSATFLALAMGIVQMVWYIKGTVMNLGLKSYSLGEETILMPSEVERYSMDWAANDGGSFSNFFQQFPTAVQEFFINKQSYASSTNSIPYRSDSSYVALSKSGESVADMLNNAGTDGAHLMVDESQGVIQALYQNPMFLYIAIACFAIFTIVLCFSLWRYWENKTPKV